MTDAVRDGLARFLSERWNKRVSIPWLSVTSAGARRLNVLFDADDGATKHELVVTAIPNANIELTPIVLEAVTIRTAEAAGVPVAHVVLDSDDTRYLGGGFFITRRVGGETVPRRVLRLVEKCKHGAAIATKLGAALAKLHAIPNERIPPHLARPENGDPAATSLLRLQEQVAGLLQPAPVVALGMRWLAARKPSPPTRPVLIHGDARNGNLIVSENGLEALLDWEGSSVGDPMADLAWPCVRTWRFGEDANEVGGFASLAPLVKGYESAGGVFDAERFHWWKVLGTLRWAIGLAGQAKAHIDGSVPNIVMAASGRRVGELEYDLLCLLRPR
ncbi:MAG TPA: phosphotransferase family protein [Pseudomonadales bacterium]|nr:phosphotransferase family protein [Pseudomonadales bacterium]